MANCAIGPVKLGAHFEKGDLVGRKAISQAAPTREPGRARAREGRADGRIPCAGGRSGPPPRSPGPGRRRQASRDGRLHRRRHGIRPVVLVGLGSREAPRVRVGGRPAAVAPVAVWSEAPEAHVKRGRHAQASAATAARPRAPALVQHLERFAHRSAYQPTGRDDDDENATSVASEGRRRPPATARAPKTMAIPSDPATEDAQLPVVHRREAIGSCFSREAIAAEQLGWLSRPGDRRSSHAVGRTSPVAASPRRGMATSREQQMFQARRDRFSKDDAAKAERKAQG